MTDASPTSHDTRPRIALLGCGTVGSEVARRLLSGWLPEVRLVKCLVRDPDKPRGVGLHPPDAPHWPDLFTSSFDNILSSSPDLVIECLGGIEPAATHISACLERCIPVVTANKTVLAHRGGDLGALAWLHRTELAYEASVAAGIPLLASLRHLRGDRVRAIRAVINGSCNFILTRMAAGLALEGALAEAGARGLVEPDPSADISGRDSAEKLVVLARALGLRGIEPAGVACRGIESITRDDIDDARRAGYAIKLVAELDAERGAANVAPALVHRDHPLAGVQDEENGIVIETELAGEIVLRGRGAGPAPTASAILGDAAKILNTRTLPGAPVVTAAPPRRHIARIAVKAGADEVLGALSARGITPSDLTIEKGCVRIVADESDGGAVDACARALSRGGRAQSLAIVE